MHTGMFTGPLAQSVHAYPTWSLAIQQTAAQFVGRYRGRAARPPLSPAPAYFAAPGNRRAGETGLAGRVHRRRCVAVLASDAVSDQVEGAVPGGSERDDAPISVGLDTRPPLAVRPGPLSAPVGGRVPCVGRPAVCLPPAAAMACPAEDFTMAWISTTTVGKALSPAGRVGGSVRGPRPLRAAAARRCDRARVRVRGAHLPAGLGALRRRGVSRGVDRQGRPDRAIGGLGAAPGRRAAAAPR